MSDSELTLKTVATDWLTPGGAVEILDSAYGDVALAKRTLLGRLRGNVLRAISMRSTVNNRSLQGVFVTADHWKRIEITDLVWRSGDLIYEYPDSRTHALALYQHFDVRFEPIEVRAIIANAPKPMRANWIKRRPEAPAVYTPTKTEEPDQEQKGPPVSPDYLKAWFDLYQKAYSGPSDTEANAMASARGMFPGKSISRDRVRELRGNQKRGRKPTGAAK